MGKPKTQARKRAARDKPLRLNQIAFVESYLQCWNATAAARRAGYSEKTAYSIGWENLRKPEIRALIDERLAAMGMDANEVLARLSAHARGDLSPFVRIDADGYAHFDLSTEQAQTALHLVKKMKFRTTVRGEGEDAVTTKEEEVEIHDPQAALVQLGRHHGLFVDKFETELPVLISLDR